MKLRRVLSTAGLGGAAALAAAAGGASWYYAQRLVQPAADAAPEPIDPGDRVRLDGADAGDDGAPTHLWLAGRDAARRGVWGVSWGDGFAQVGRVTRREGDRALREVLGQWGHQAPASTEAVFDPNAYPADPEVLGLAWDEVTFQSPVGDFPAWRFTPRRRASTSTWALFVHGRSARRHECFRILPTVVDRGVTALAISYRNDPGAPRSPDGHSHLGATEWEDVEGAVIWALSQGAQDVVLYGFSMGGACVVNFLRRSAHADRVRGVVLEAPVLDWGPVIRRAAVHRGIPDVVLPVLLPATMGLAKLHAGIDWAQMRHVDATHELRHEALLIQGDADPIVPVELADSLAAARPDLITYLRVPGAGHVRSWNVDPEAYEAAVGTYLDRALEGTLRRRRRPWRR